jgi:hypothetical protein
VGLPLKRRQGHPIPWFYKRKTWTHLLWYFMHMFPILLNLHLHEFMSVPVIEVSSF